ncbi:MAG: winged helix-turn-helix transcriptional regulator [Vulcanimicrobiaceae bacterium]
MEIGTPISPAAAQAVEELLADPYYGTRNCPMQDAISMIADKWKLLILIELSRASVLRFKELQRSLGTVSQKVLTSALRELEGDGLVERTIYAEVPPRVEYRPTERVRKLLPILQQLNDWAAATGSARS